MNFERVVWLSPGQEVAIQEAGDHDKPSDGWVKVVAPGKAVGNPEERCRVYWGSHGCDRPRGHEGPHLCLSCREADEEGWVGAPPYYGPETRFYGEDVGE